MATKRSSLRIAVVAILALVAVVILTCAFFQTTTVEIVPIDDGYDIRICTSGRSFLPLTAEGPFPEWSELSWFNAEGPGEAVEREGMKYKKYSIGKDLYSSTYARGSLWISEASATLIVDADLSKENEDHGIMNHSGKYEGVAIYHPLPLTVDTPDERVDGQYVRVRGHFDEKGNRFEAAGRSFPNYCGVPYGCTKTETYEVVGVFHAHHVDHPNEPQISIFTFRKIDDR
jgi:hypothetical protein